MRATVSRSSRRWTPRAADAGPAGARVRAPVRAPEGADPCRGDAGTGRRSRTSPDRPLPGKPVRRRPWAGRTCCSASFIVRLHRPRSWPAPVRRVPVAAAGPPHRERPSLPWPGASRPFPSWRTASATGRRQESTPESSDGTTEGEGVVTAARPGHPAPREGRHTHPPSGDVNPHLTDIDEVRALGEAACFPRRLEPLGARTDGGGVRAIPLHLRFHRHQNQSATSPESDYVRRCPNRGGPR